MTGAVSNAGVAVGYVGEIGQKICPWDAAVNEELLSLAYQ